MATFFRIVLVAGFLAVCSLPAIALPTSGSRPARKTMVSRDSMRASARSIFAQVLTQNLSPLSSREGVWRGRVQGAGNVSLALEISRAGRLVERRLMGKVKLNGNSTWFAFRSWLPKGTDWAWKVVAWVE